MPRANLRLIKSDDSIGLPAIIANTSTRMEVEELAQQLFDALMEMMDIIDGDPDLKHSGDEFEDGEGL
jgi:hypothetical protein